MTVLMKTVFPQHCPAGGPGPEGVLGNAETTGCRIMTMEPGLLSAHLLCKKGRTGSLRAEMGGQRHTYINIARGQLFLNNLS